MTDDIKVTIWCLAYNHEKYIRNTLEGFVLQKTNFKYEVLVHDDASTDGTAAIIEEYADKFPDVIRPIYEKENQYSKGVNMSQEILLPNARGKYIAYCEGDDYWCDTEKLQIQFNLMEKYPEVSLCVHKVQCINENGTFNKRIIPEKDYGLEKDILLDQEGYAELLWVRGTYPFHTSSFFHKKEVLQTEMMRELRRYMNGDMCILRSSLLCGKVFYIDNTMSCRRLLSIGNWNQTFHKKSNEEKINYFIKHIKGEQIFDEYTDGKYHVQIENTIYKTIIGMMGDFGKSNIPSPDLYLGEKYDIKDIVSVKIRLKWFLLMHFSGAYIFLRRIKQKLIH